MPIDRKSLKNYLKIFGDLFKSSVGASFIIGFFVSLIVMYTMIPRAESNYLMLLPSFLFILPTTSLLGMIIGLVLAFPAILAGTAALICLSKAGCTKKHHSILSGLLVGATYGLLLEQIPHLALEPSYHIPIVVFAAGGTLAGYIYSAKKSPPEKEEKSL